MQIQPTTEYGYQFDLSFSLFGSSKTITQDATEICKLVLGEQPVTAMEKAIAQSKIRRRVENVVFRLVEP